MDHSILEMAQDQKILFPWRTALVIGGAVVGVAALYAASQLQSGPTVGDSPAPSVPSCALPRFPFND